MDVARDLVDRQLADRGGDQCGRVDDLWLEWDARGAHLGALESGTRILLDQLGAAGRLLQRIGGARAQRSRTIEWASVAQVERTRLVLAAVPALASDKRFPEPGSRRYSAVARLPVIDAAGEQRSVLDVRCETAISGTEPRVLGLIACRHTWLRTLGMKRYDAAGVPLADVQSHARFVPWSAVAEVDDEIRLRVLFHELPRLGDVPDPGPPPWPRSDPGAP
jgi:hypothetical protein